MSNSVKVENSKYSVEIYNLSKVYKLKGKDKTKSALHNINLKVREGEIFGLLGPNGAGKTTMISILTTLLKPTSGYATVLGYNILKQPKIIKQNIGLMLGGDMIYHRITGYQNLRFFSKIYGINDYQKKISNIAEKLSISKWLNQYTENYSTGMKLKLALARILLIEPKIFFLDEPMLGLDPKSVQDVIKILKDLKQTIFLTSHQMDIVQQLCDRIAFLKQGEIIKIDTQQNFKKLIMDKINIKLEVRKDSNKLIQLLKSLDYINNIKKENNDILFSISKDTYFPEIFNYLKDFSVSKFNQIEPNLSDVFISLSK